jgi:hypothetical protein
MISLCVFSALMLGLIYYTVMISHMIARNMTVNHSHDTSRSTVERAWSDLHNSASYFVLMSYNGSTYTDVTPSYSSTSDVDLYYYTGSTGYVINDNRANAVRFMVLGGGPYQITGDGNGSATVAATATSVEVNAYDGYVPVVGDKIVIPVINQTFDIITPAPSVVTGTSYKINIGLISGSGSSSTTSSQAIGTTIYTTAGATTTGFSYGATSSTNPLQYPAFTTASIYHRVAYTVYNQQFQYHPNFTAPTQGYPASAWSASAGDLSSTVTLRTNVTSPLPFGLLAATSAGPALQTFLRMSLESYDLTYAVGMYTDGTTTVQTTIPSRTVPPVITSY